MIAAINGPITVHSEYALLCDIVIATEDAYSQDAPHPAFGIVTGDGLHVVWPQVWWPHFEFTRANITPTILPQKIQGFARGATPVDTSASSEPPSYFDLLHRSDYDRRRVQGRIRSAERVEAHLSTVVSRTFFQPDLRTPGASMKGGRYVD